MQHKVRLSFSLLDQERNIREIERLNGDVEAKIMSQIYILKVNHQEKLQAALQV